MKKKEPHLNYCAHDGYLVGGRYQIPSSIFEYQALQSNPFIGCNQVFCDNCLQFVRQKTGYRMKSYSRADLKRWAVLLSENDDWDSLDFLEKEARGGERIYYCACHSFPTGTCETLDGYSDHPLFPGGYGKGWKCNGHPQRTTS